MTLTHEEFLRRFLQHVLPKGFPRIRYFGWLANRRRRCIAAALPTLLAAHAASATPADPPEDRGRGIARAAGA